MSQVLPFVTISDFTDKQARGRESCRQLGKERDRPLSCRKMGLQHSCFVWECTFVKCAAFLGWQMANVMHREKSRTKYAFTLHSFDMSRFCRAKFLSSSAADGFSLLSVIKYWIIGLLVHFSAPYFKSILTVAQFHATPSQSISPRGGMFLFPFFIHPFFSKYPWN